MPGLEAVFDEFIFPYEDLQTKWMTGEFQRDKMSYVVISRLIILSFIDIDIRELKIRGQEQVRDSCHHSTMGFREVVVAEKS